MRALSEFQCQGVSDFWLGAHGWLACAHACMPLCVQALWLLEGEGGAAGVGGVLVEK